MKIPKRTVNKTSPVTPADIKDGANLLCEDYYDIKAAMDVSKHQLDSCTEQIKNFGRKYGERRGKLKVINTGTHEVGIMLKEKLTVDEAHFRKVLPRSLFYKLFKVKVPDPTYEFQPAVANKLLREKKVDVKVFKAGIQKTTSEVVFVRPIKKGTREATFSDEI